ncbi:nucleotidyl transferase AbiEii/AbiGii toxin family protein [Bradyrhizobium liaoningense]|uniref:nucleotidyl transferase AbiEii/AbiGii toxin family protein n=1 Tax=Bradyrhizobium liaoningense TaxID=43992 RepID=UPI0028969A06|nr:nucleotidyl transferase AbiEii/AbiGii toxin family protein [Bradyrhizobium liaoningense]
MTPVLRGCVFDPEMRSVLPNVEESFGFAETQVVSFSDLYAGKIVAALDRQHPRDLFDIRDLLANEGISDDLRRAFIVYLISHDRPISEVVAPRRKDIRQEFEHGFEGMTSDPVSLDEQSPRELDRRDIWKDAEGASGISDRIQAREARLDSIGRRWSDRASRSPMEADQS